MKKRGNPQTWPECGSMEVFYTICFKFDHICLLREPSSIPYPSSDDSRQSKRAVSFLFFPKTSDFVNK